MTGAVTVRRVARALLSLSSRLPNRVLAPEAHLSFSFLIVKFELPLTIRVSFVFSSYKLVLNPVFLGVGGTGNGEIPSWSHFTQTSEF